MDIQTTSWLGCVWKWGIIANLWQLEWGKWMIIMTIYWNRELPYFSDKSTSSKVWLWLMWQADVVIERVACCSINQVVSECPCMLSTCQPWLLSTCQPPLDLRHKLLITLQDHRGFCWWNLSLLVLSQYITNDHYSIIFHIFLIFCLLDPDFGFNQIPHFEAQPYNQQPSGLPDRQAARGSNARSWETELRPWEKKYPRNSLYLPVIFNLFIS